MLLIVVIGWSLRHLAAGRAIYATGSNERAAQLAGFDTARIKTSLFALAGSLTGVAAVMNAVRFNQIPSNSGLGLEMKVIAAVVVGGTAVRGGRGTILGSVLGVILLGAIGPALTFIGVSAYWERAIHGAIILVAVGADAIAARRRRPVGATLAPELGSPTSYEGGGV
jgi:rhamnose transport system permease protein